MTTIRLKRFGTQKRPYFRIVVQDNRIATSSKTLDEIGLYHPIEKNVEDQVKLDKEKAQSWILKGAVPSETVKKIFNKQGISLNRKAQA